MNRLKRFRGDILSLAVLIVLPLLWFGPVLFPGWGGSTLLPFDNLYSFEPFRSMLPGLVPHNNLLSDLVLENFEWKLHIQRAFAAGQIPLWNPDIFTGIPFFAAGQASVAYPLSLLFYIFPIEAAYGWFTALQLAIAGINMYIFGRVLRLRPVAALFVGLVFMFSGFMIVSVVFTMVIAAASWLPLVLAVIELIIRKQEEKGVESFRPIPYVIVGAAAIGVMTLAGHPEFFYYTLLVSGMYAAVRLGLAWGEIKAKGKRQSAKGKRGGQSDSPFAIRIVKLAGWLLVMAGLGIALGAVQLIPLYELVTLNFRAGSASYQDVIGWAWPSRHVLTFGLPDVFGNPSHHGWFDIWNRTWVPARVNALGEPTDTIFWGIKNYVEGGNYLGLLTWVLAILAVVRLFAAPFPKSEHSRATWIFGGLALLSLAFAFGTPLYSLLFFGLPGWNQLHSPFRWVFPFTVSMAVLGGLGLNALLELMVTQAGDWRIGRGLRRVRFRSVVRVLAGLMVAAGIDALAAVVVSLFVPAPFIGLGDKALAGSDLARMAFADGRMFWSYQAINLVKFGGFALASGLLLVWMTVPGRMPHLRTNLPPKLARRFTLTGALAIALIVLDLFAAHGTFNPSTDPALSPLKNVPPVVQFINEREGIDTELAIRHSPFAFRFTTFNLPGEKTLNANMGMAYGWQDIRGYDSIIPKQYVDLMDRVAPQAGELLYNRIAPIYSNVAGSATLENPLLDLLNVKYVLTTQSITADGWTEIYRDEGIAAYENSQVLPRALIVPEAQVVAADQQPLLSADLSRTLFIEENPADANALVPSSPQIAEATISRYTPNDVFVDVNLSDRAWLLLSDAYFPGWKAYVRPFGGTENDETELTIQRADGGLRAVYLPEAGQWTVRFTYSPMSFKVGLYVSFLAFMAGLLLLLWWGWGKFYRPSGAENEAQTVAKNSIVPMILNLANKAVDFAFAMLYVRLLGPEGTGKYAFVVAMYGFFEIVSRYGLGTLLTRDVAADKNESSRYLTNVLALRTLLWLVAMPVMGAVVYGYRIFGNITTEEIMALAIFGAAMLFANYADGLSSMFNAFEKMEYPAGLATASGLLKVTLGAAVLLAGWGFVGLAAVSLTVNILQVFWLYGLVRRTLFQPQWQWDWSLQKWMFATSGPLMINHLLATIFWRIDLWILRPLAGAASIGLYSVSLKYLDGLNIIPSVFTFAIFPLMSRYARREGEGLLRSYLIAVRLLLIASLPIAMMTTFIAAPLVFIVGGGEFLNVPEVFTVFGRAIPYMGGSQLALQVIIWSIPIGFVNSVTQFVLIAVDQQRYLTRAFLFGVLFNVVGNILLIPSFGYIGAAVVTILSELSLLVPFYWSVRKHVGTVPWAAIIWRPLVAVGVMGLSIFGLTKVGLNVWTSVIVGWLIYGVVLVAAGAFRGEDMAIVGRALPLGKLRGLRVARG
ncbi:MAG: polysaccharide biosynthesis C-terminal domain-containing protein [Caldilineaceae bacterium]|nr:polysaccharide biosynthesis C-terminal domain-containing protein [Caldilineaceae bacterium]MBP8109308.1 polysaccharide biosynthesis C-terminal domain-containing protein [Caldilineaceae bacterium]MBP8121019.1 polysaccharide biosynthesis C-terminal domain-containing protein [Caldilineaceae bacterium]MBP9071766.1 polysaccharide biosynthesis C-terminal domain-containing protein [Caldilineaceae bacterium]